MVTHYAYLVSWHDPHPTVRLACLPPPRAVGAVMTPIADEVTCKNCLRTHAVRRLTARQPAEKE